MYSAWWPWCWPPTPKILKIFKPPILACLSPVWPTDFSDLARLVSLQIRHPLCPHFTMSLRVFCKPRTPWVLQWQQPPHPLHLTNPTLTLEISPAFHLFQDVPLNFLDHSEDPISLDSQDHTHYVCNLIFPSGNAHTGDLHFSASLSVIDPCCQDQANFFLIN